MNAAAAPAAPAAVEPGDLKVGAEKPETLEGKHAKTPVTDGDTPVSLGDGDEADMDDDDYDEQEERTPNAVAMKSYFAGDKWKQETTTRPFTTWTSDEVFTWLKAQQYPSTFSKKQHEFMHKLLSVLDKANMDGGLLVAGGHEYLKELAISRMALQKSQGHSFLMKCIRMIFHKVEEAQALEGRVSYWSRLQATEMGEALCKEYADNAIGKLLQQALEPQPLRSLLYTKLVLKTTTVLEADLYVSKRVLPSHRHKKFKLVGLALEADKHTVVSTLVYGRSGANQWELLASVDFKQHGVAPPGHWHLNRTSRGGIMPHSNVSVQVKVKVGLKAKPSRTQWGKGEVWHGAPDSCPLWWLFLPRGMRYASETKRIRNLMATFDVDSEETEDSSCDDE